MKYFFLLLPLFCNPANASQADDTPIGYYMCKSKKISFSKEIPSNKNSSSLKTYRCEDLQLLPTKTEGSDRQALVWKNEERDGVLWLHVKLENNEFVWLKAKEKNYFYTAESTFSTGGIWEPTDDWDRRIYKKAGGSVFEDFGRYVIAVEYIEKKIVNGRFWIKIKAYDGHLCGNLIDLPKVIITGWILAVNEEGTPNIEIPSCD